MSLGQIVIFGLCVSNISNVATITLFLFSRPVVEDSMANYVNKNGIAGDKDKAQIKCH